MPLQRIPEWRFRLGQILDTARQLQFEWGVFDCALHVCNCIRAMTGVDPAAKYRGTYHDEPGAALIYGTSLENFVVQTAAQFACPEVRINFARPGDLVLIDNGTPQGAIGIVTLDARFVSCASDKGIALARRHRWKRTWAIG